MATMTTRIPGTPKERLIAILLLALGVPCSAQLATITGILGGISFAALATLFAVVWVRCFWSDGSPRGAQRRALGIHSRAAADSLAASGNLVTKTRLRVRWYLGEAVPLFSRAPRSCSCSIGRGARRRAAALRPVVTGLLGLPARRRRFCSWGSCAGLRRRRIVSARARGRLTGLQAVVALTVMTLFVPCVANFLMMVRERGLRRPARDSRRRDARWHPDGSGLIMSSEHSDPVLVVCARWCRCRKARVESSSMCGRTPICAQPAARAGRPRARASSPQTFPGIVFLCDQTGWPSSVRRCRDFRPRGGTPMIRHRLRLVSGKRRRPAI